MEKTDSIVITPIDDLQSDECRFTPEQRFSAKDIGKAVDFLGTQQAGEKIVHTINTNTSSISTTSPNRGTADSRATGDGLPSRDFSRATTGSEGLGVPQHDEKSTNILTE